jgi:hypothetical protein
MGQSDANGHGIAGRELPEFAAHQTMVECEELETHLGRRRQAGGGEVGNRAIERPRGIGLRVIMAITE